jgi:hypothetical protein
MFSSSLLYSKWEFGVSKIGGGAILFSPTVNGSNPRYLFNLYYWNFQINEHKQLA